MGLGGYLAGKAEQERFQSEHNEKVMRLKEFQKESKKKFENY